MIRSPGPDEWRRILVVHVDVLADGGFQLFDTSEDAPANALVSEFGEPAFYQVDPRTVGGREVDVKSRALSEPFPAVLPKKVPVLNSI